MNRVKIRIIDDDGLISEKIVLFLPRDARGNRSWSPHFNRFAAGRNIKSQFKNENPDPLLLWNPKCQPEPGTRVWPQRRDEWWRRNDGPRGTGGAVWWQRNDSGSWWCWERWNATSDNVYWGRVEDIIDGKAACWRRVPYLLRDFWSPVQGALWSLVLRWVFYYLFVHDLKFSFVLII